MKDNNNSLAVPNLTIPPEAHEAAFAAYDQCKGGVAESIAAAIRAALAAWPGVQHRVLIEQAIILPLTEPRDA